MLLVKLPAPVPFNVLVDNDTVGFNAVLQHTPFEVTDTPPSAVTFPPLVAVVYDIADAAAVVIFGEQPPHVGTPSHIVSD